MGCFQSKKKEPLLNDEKKGPAHSQRSSFIEAKTILSQIPSPVPAPRVIVEYEPPKINEALVNRLSLPYAPAQKEITSFINTNNFTHPVKVC